MTPDVGEKVAEMVQVPPLAATEEPQLFVVAKFVVLPLNTMLVIPSAIVPLLVTVTVCAAVVVPAVVVVKVITFAERVAVGAALAVLLPATVKNCCEPAMLPALSVMVMTPLYWVEAAAGEKVTEMVQ